MDGARLHGAHGATLLELSVATPAEATDGLDEPLGDLLAGGPTPDVSRLPATAH